MISTTVLNRLHLSLSWFKKTLVYRYKGSKRFCYICGSDETYVDRNNCHHWRIHKETKNRYCKKCWSKHFDNPMHKEQFNKIWRPKYNKKVIKFKDKPIGLFSMRTGICSECGKSKHKGEIKITNIHHWNYIIIFPWFCTRELCVSCHNKERIGTHYSKKVGKVILA